MDEEKKLENIGAPSAPAEETTPKETEPLQNPVQKELEKVQTKKSVLSRRERLEFERRKIEEQLAEEDQSEGIVPTVSAEVPEWYRKARAEEAKQTALQMAEAIEDQSERDLTKHHLQNTIRPSGNPSEDLRLARSIVNGVRNTQIAEELARKSAPKTYSSGSGAPAKPADGVFEPNTDEAALMRPPFNLSKEDILKARAEQQRTQE